MNIRVASVQDSDHINKVHHLAFPEEENAAVAQLAVDLLAEEATPQILSLVAEVDSKIVGHVAYSPVSVHRKKWLGYILAPLAVIPEYHGRSIGSALIQDGIKRLSAMEVTVLFVYGDPEYYGRFGFRTDSASRYDPPYELQYPFGWQALVLDQERMLTKSAKITCVQALSSPALW